GGRPRRGSRHLGRRAMAGFCEPRHARARGRRPFCHLPCCRGRAWDHARRPPHPRRSSGPPAGDLAMTVRVLYLAGTGRSGSTLLARILDRADGVFAAGELRYVWQRGVLEDRLCGCGEPFSSCPFWTEVMDRAFGGRNQVDAQQVIADQRALTRLRQVPRILTTGGRAAPGDYLSTLS